MTNREIAIEVLRNHSCLTGSQIRSFAKRLLNIDITPQSAAAALRPLIATGMVGKSPDPVSGNMAYWLTDYGKEQLLKQK